MAVTFTFDSELDMINWTNTRENNMTAHFIMLDFDQWLRRITKHTDEKDWPNANAIRGELWDICGNHDYDIYEEG
ncbi:MAG: hypothetical protein U9Q17_03080 [Chloroflexota bacterium]|nr:hypothetical protein [Chloroflexota bacterium]